MSGKLPSSVLAAGLLTAALPLAGCATLSGFSGVLDRAATVLFTSATLADLQVVGVKSGPVIPLGAGSFDTSAASGQGPIQELANVLGQIPLGVLLPITKVGETTPMWIFCPAGKLQKRCEEVPANARVTFAGEPLGHSVVFLAHHVTWSAQ